MLIKKTYLILIFVVAITAQSYAAPCNAKIPFINANFSNNLTASRSTSANGALFCGVPGSLISGYPDNSGTLIDASLTNYAEFTPVLCNMYYTVVDGTDTYPAGTYAGYKINAGSLLGISVAYTITIETRNNGNIVESKEVASNLIGINPNLLNGSQDATLGFITTEDFDEIRFKYSAALSLGKTIKVYYPVIETFCSGSSLNCNEKTAINNTSFPVIINSENTGYTGVACVACALNDGENILSPSNTDYATLDLTAGLLSVSKVSVQDVLTTYPAGYFAGFEIENTNILGVDLLDGITITTYLDGNFQESNSGTSGLLSISSSLLTGSGKASIGFLTTKDFDEVEIKFSNILTVNLGETKIYNLIIERFCPNTLETDTTYWLNAPNFPVIVNEKKSGLSDLACALCTISETENLITPNTSDYSTISTPLGVANTSSISIKDVLNTYPPGSNVGFNIEDLEGILQADLFNSIEICTYNNDTLQECQSGINLIDINILNVLRIGGANQYNIGFTTNKEFDEIKFTSSSLVTLLNRINIHGVFVEIRNNLLPIELLSFEVTEGEKNQANLAWSTATEINNDYFVIQRSTDGISWIDIDEVTGSGNSHIIQNYTYIDKKTETGLNYYRLKQVDYDGGFSFSEIKVIEISTSIIPSNINIYPNPSVNGNLNIENNSNKNFTYSLYNIVGKKVLEKNISNGQNSINISNLNSGIYFLKVEDETYKINIEN